MQLYLDCDGVLADFERAATEMLRMPPRAFEKRHGLGEFWKRLARHPDFYGSLPLMPDAMELFEAVRHLNPIILTGLPRGDWAAPQKVRWAAEHFPGTRIITCLAADKRRHAREGDILVDDTLKYQALWNGAGGIFVHHRNAPESIEALRRLIPEEMAAAAD
jgi:5'(3')-deoxyribonucleotidase